MDEEKMVREMPVPMEREHHVNWVRNDNRNRSNNQ